MKNKYNLEYLHGTFRSVHYFRYRVDDPVAFWVNSFKTAVHVHLITLNKTNLTL